uniref:Uncharacterized protein n=1 Tax=Grammatophora oceanica TaxID=210454 RepID=A0A7S1Y6V5_9STRA
MARPLAFSFLAAASDTRCRASSAFASAATLRAASIPSPLSHASSLVPNPKVSKPDSFPHPHHSPFAHLDRRRRVPILIPQSCTNGSLLIDFIFSSYGRKGPCFDRNATLLSGPART